MSTSRPEKNEILVKIVIVSPPIIPKYRKHFIATVMCSLKKITDSEKCSKL